MKTNFQSDRAVLIKCGKTKTKVVDQYVQSQQTQTAQTNQHLKQMQVNSTKHGKVHMSKSRLVFDLTSDLLNKWCKFFFNQSQSIVKRNQSKCKLSTLLKLNFALGKWIMLQFI